LARLGLPLISRPAAIGDEACPVEGPFVLVTPELKGRPDVVVRTDDILEPPPADLAGAADVVRIVNVLRPTISRRANCDRSRRTSGSAAGTEGC
jgi:hypothetical protein